MSGCRQTSRSTNDRLKFGFAALVLLALGALLFDFLGLDGVAFQAAEVRAHRGSFAHDHSSHGHSHAESGTTGDVLQRRLEEQLAEKGLSSHVGDPNEGFVLRSKVGQESVRQGKTCSPGSPVREYSVATINVEITLNRFLDHDLLGCMYVLDEDLARVRREEAQNRTARATGAEPAVTQGLQGDAIQPLTIRVNQGECLRVTLRNGLKDGEPGSFHLHGSGRYIAPTGQAALATNPDTIVAPGESVIYEWMVEADEQEGTHYFHSHGNSREQTSHGLFGAVIVEPKGSAFLDPIRDRELRSGWAAIIQNPSGSDFREFVFYYHEIGNDKFRHRDRDGKQVSLSDPITHIYKPGGRALSYRSEPFMNRLKLQEETIGLKDEALGYGSYSFGDPATPISRTYLGDPVKQRPVHGGSEVLHVHHVHGGSIRWRRQPATERTEFDGGFEKRPHLLPQASERLDSQGILPSETYDIENQCGAGGCQHSVADFLIHCHVPDHYIGGMWMFWRDYNTLQDGTVSKGTPCHPSGSFPTGLAGRSLP